MYIEKRCEEAENITKVSEIQSRLFGKIDVRVSIHLRNRLGDVMSLALEGCRANRCLASVIVDRAESGAGVA